MARDAIPRTLWRAVISRANHPLASRVCCPTCTRPRPIMSNRSSRVCWLRTRCAISPC